MCIQKCWKTGDMIAVGVSDEDVLDTQLQIEIRVESNTSRIDADAFINQVGTEELGWTISAHC